MSNNTFESGATNAASNNLILSVLNDGTVYDERIHAAKRMFHPFEHDSKSKANLVLISSNK